MNEAIQIETKPQVIITDNEDGLTKAIASVFPDQLCLWHIEKKVLEKISKKLGRNKGTESDKVKEFLTEWTTMVNHSTVSEFEDSWAKLQEKWNETASSWDVIEYFTNEYIHKKEKFV